MNIDTIAVKGGGGAAADYEADNEQEDGQLASCIRQTDGIQLSVGDEIFFERNDTGTLEGGYVIDLIREAGVVYAIVRYKDKAWAYDCYNEKKDVERLMMKDQLMMGSRTKRAAKPVTRFQPPQEIIKPKLPKIKVLEDEEKRKRRKKRLRRARRKRRALKRRKRELAMEFFSAENDTSEEFGSALTGAEKRELMALLGVTELAQIREALTLFFNSEEKTSSDSSATSSVSSRFPESESSEESLSSSESEVGISDISTDSCPSDPEFTYWKRIRDPTQDALKVTGLERFGICPKCDSSDSEESDEDYLEMGLTGTVVAWTHRERWELLKEYLKRRSSIQRRARTGAISYKEWCLALHLISEDVGGLDHLESCSAIKGVKRCDGMRTMYGAIRAPLIQEMIRFAGVGKNDRFIDIGSGLGTVVLHMAAATGCQATGIELETSRFTLSAMLNEELIKLMREIGTEASFVTQLKNRIEMINGDIRIYEHKILESTAIYFNNHGVWFDETASKEGEISVEHWVAKLFAKTAVGTRLVILKSIPHLKGDWFKEEVYLARSDWLTWARDDKPLFCYTKLKDTWTCEKCLHENEIVRDDQFIWEMKCFNNCASSARLRCRPTKDGSEA